MMEDTPEVHYLHLGPPMVGQTVRVGTTLFIDGVWQGTPEDANKLLRMSRFYPVRRGAEYEPQEGEEAAPEKPAGPTPSKKTKAPVTRRKKATKKKASKPSATQAAKAAAEAGEDPTGLNSESGTPDPNKPEPEGHTTRVAD